MTLVDVNSRASCDQSAPESKRKAACSTVHAQLHLGSSRCIQSDQVEGVPVHASANCHEPRALGAGYALLSHIIVNWRVMDCRETSIARQAGAVDSCDIVAWHVLTSFGWAQTPFWQDMCQTVHEK